MIGYIYKITNKITGKSYIGQTSKPIAKRLIEHSCAASRCTRLKSSISAHGRQNFIIECLEIIEAEEKDILISKMNNLEKQYIQLLNTLHPNGYNLTSGGFRPVLSKSVVDLIAEKHKKPIKCNETGQEWPSVKDCAAYFNVKPKQISKVLKRQRKRLKWKYTFSYLRQS